MLVIPGLEERNRGEGAAGIGKKKIQLRRSWRIHVVTRRSDLASRVAAVDVQLVQRDQHCLREIQRSVICRRNRHDRVGEIERFIGEAIVLATKENADISMLRELAPDGRAAFRNKYTFKRP